ncbi:MAG: amidohydrolase [Bacteroidales bacterium]|nr:amidohydrolase [Bacteroidales bacterium]
MRTLLHNAILNDKAVDITLCDGLIDSVSTASCSPQSAALTEECASIDCSGLSVFPGLMNMHSHAPMTLFRGLGDDQPLDRWLNEYIWPAEQKLTDETVYQGTLQACREMLASGTTAFNDMYFHLPAMAQAVRDSGIRAQLGLNVFGDGNELDRLNTIMRECEGVRLSIAPHSVYTVSAKGLRRCADACVDLHLPMHIHMSETQKEVDDCLREHGCRPWEYLDRLGILDKLGPNIIAAHCLHLSGNEIRLIGDRRITCVHCPNSNLKLGSGYRFPMLELLDAGANVMLGTDGSASSNNLDMIEVMKTAALLQKGWRGDPTVVPAQQILTLATGGHTVAPGQPACLFLAPVRSVSDLVYATHGESVAMTLVDGKIVYRK